MWKTVGIILLVVIISAGAVFLIMQRNQGTAHVNVTVQGIKEIAQLATTEYAVSAIVDWQKPLGFAEWVPARLMVVATGKIKGSVDLEKMKITISPEADKKSVILRFDPGAILISDPEICADNCLRTITCSDPNIFNKLNDGDRQNVQNMALEQLKAAALKSGIREKTASEAKSVLTRFLQQLGYEATIEFADEDLAAVTVTNEP